MLRGARWIAIATALAAMCFGLTSSSRLGPVPQIGSTAAKKVAGQEFAAVRSFWQGYLADHYVWLGPAFELPKRATCKSQPFVALACFPPRRPVTTILVQEEFARRLLAGEHGPAGRRLLRFIIAHEYGHFIVDELARQRYITVPAAGPRGEVLADCLGGVALFRRGTWLTRSEMMQWLNFFFYLNGGTEKPTDHTTPDYRFAAFQIGVQRGSADQCLKAYT